LSRSDESLSKSAVDFPLGDALAFLLNCLSSYYSLNLLLSISLSNYLSNLAYSKSSLDSVDFSTAFSATL